MDVVMSTLLCGVLQILYIQTVLGNGCLSSQGSCCILCNPGYFRTQECGPCKPCPVTGYTDKPNNQLYCDHCRRCEGIFSYKEKCTSTSNAVCTCIPGKKCTDEKCTQCRNDRCLAGQQLVGSKCVTCPLGTFNTGAERICTPWKNCSALGGIIIINGTHTSNVVCGGFLTKATKSPGPSSEVNTTTDTRQVLVPSPGESHLQIIYIVASCAVSLLFIAICVACRWKLTEKIKHVCQEIPKPIVKQTEEEDGCSCHFPEEENGGENEPMTLEA
ncbi:tumor necrosis factor receptor superfamily member 9 [Bufo gargarizans]|uniref:tumor necrosis factor receptor superfamily member 9 n=1 Tax=Bufo gargarizans TaxID=30331 RepID=UPI001CF3A405|nr:tumor necrosis factor receptor superfamily member 9 [Bufo gargarizans]